jgi:hypothetical protein
MDRTEALKTGLTQLFGSNPTAKIDPRLWKRTVKVFVTFDLADLNAFLAFVEATNKATTEAGVTFTAAARPVKEKPVKAPKPVKEKPVKAPKPEKKVNAVVTKAKNKVSAPVKTNIRKAAKVDPFAPTDPSDDVISV